LLARDILGVHAASVGLERLFSDARRTGKYDRQYDPDTFQAIQESRYHYKIEDSNLTRELERTLFVPCMAPSTSQQKIEIEQERRVSELQDIMGLHYISDTDETGTSRTPTPTPPSNVMKGKRRRPNSDEGTALRRSIRTTT
jgi:hypothetical protein